MKIFTLKNVTTLFLLLLCSLMAIAQQSYCTPTWSGWAVNEPTEPITLVQLGQNGINGINNPSAGVVSADTPRYEDFSATAMNVVKGQTYNLVIKGNTDGDNTNYITLYIDWNGDGTFSNATPANEAAQQVLTNQPEKHQHLPALVNSTGTDGISVTHNIIIPTDAATGTIRMRIVKNYNAPSNGPCSNPFIFGQVEDYTLNITNTTEEPGTGCANTEPGLTAGDTGCVSFTYQGSQVSYTTVRGTDGNIWLQQNLGSTQVAGTMADEEAYGDLFQWGRWADGHQKRTSLTTATTPAPNNPTGLGAGSDLYITGTPAWWATNALTDTWTAATPETVTDTDGCDPCRALGQGWQLPTEANWEALVTAEGIANPATAFASTLKLPASGYRSNTSGALTYTGTRGYYWSATTSTTGAKYLYVGTTIGNPSAGAPRGQGAAIRCVKLQPAQVQSVVVATQNSVPATIVAAAGTLQLAATVNPVAANQNVTWSVTTGGAFATVNATGLVTATANGTVTIRATSVADATKFGELSVVINIPPANECPSLTSLYENFDTLSCCAMGVVPTCWESILLGGASQIISSTQPASGTSQIYMNGYGAGKIAIVVLPHFSNVSAGTHQFRFKLKANSTGGLLEFGYITNVDDAATFVVLQAITVNNSSYNSADAERTIVVPATVPAGARLAVRNPGTTWAGMYWDDVYWETIAVTSVVVATQNNVPATIITANGTKQLVATVNPSQVSQNVTWSIVSGSEYATVDANGLVTATANGTVTVRATSVVDTTKFDDIEIAISYTIAVQAVVVTTQNGVPATISTQNGTLQLVAAVTPANATNQNVTWSIVSGNAFATVDASGLVTATGNGTVTVRATSDSNPMLYGEIEITISYTIPVASVTVVVQNGAAATITTIDGTLQLVVTVAPANATNTNVTWSIVTGSEFASVDASGLVTAANNGAVVVRATAVDGTIYGEITVTITGQLTCQELYPGATEPITLVNFAGINNESAAAVGGAFTEDFTTLVAQAQRGQNYVLTVKGNTNGDFAHHVIAYADWNQNMSFADAGETYTVGTLQNTTGIDEQAVTVTIEVPADAVLGNATLRIVKTLDIAALPCNTSLYGQTEYYTINVLEQTAGLDDITVNKISLYPNPATDIINIQAAQPVKMVQVYTTLGQKVLTGSSNKLNIASLSQGIYIVNIALDNGATESFKVIKQ